jgi:hypothetical protein
VISKVVNRSRLGLWLFRDRLRDFVRGSQHRRATFARIYRENLWGNGESRSGGGSTLEVTSKLREELPSLTSSLGIKVLLDAPCGDANWISAIFDRFPRYVGVDIVPELIKSNDEQYRLPNVSFLCADITCDPLPRADLILCRDCFIHLPLRSIRMALENFRSTGAEYLLLTSDSSIEDYIDVPAGSFRPVNFRRPPFSFPEPEWTIREGAQVDVELCLWRLPNLEI